MIKEPTNAGTNGHCNANGATRGSAAPRIAMIGCGAIAERYHLPGLSEIPGVLERVVLVDRSIDRTQLMAERFGIPRQATDVAEVIGQIDGAIVAVPPAFHHSICRQLLLHDVPVFCEKPLAESAAEGREMVALARDRRVALCANHTRRLLPAYAEIKRLLAEGTIGEVREINWEEGIDFDWPAASAFHFRSGARGALLDTGIHSLDLICWWLGQKPEVVESRTDSFGGPETMAEVRLRSGQCKIRVKLSWLSQLANRYSIVGDRGTISGKLDYFDRLTISPANGRSKQRRLRSAARTYNDFGSLLIANYIDVIADRAEPLVPAASVLPALEVMDACYESAQRMSMPWLQIGENVFHASA